MIILSLIVKRARVKALVKDKRTAMEAFGTYVEVGIFNIHEDEITDLESCLAFSFCSLCTEIC